MEQKAISSDLIRGHIDTIILYSLMSGDKFAQQISDSIEEKSNGEYKMIQATLYSSLKRLETLKLVSSYWCDSVDVGGRRKYFSITESGKNAVKSNLDSWSFSRSLIDKLVDCQPEPIYQTQVQVVEKIVEVPVEKIVEVPVEVAVEKIVEVPSNSIPDSVVLQTATTENTDKKNVDDSSLSTTQEINFRHILNGLIKSSAPKKEQVEITELKPVERVENQQENTSEKLKFNDTISIVDYNEQKASNNGKIDFGDLLLQAAKDGYKLRVSSKDSTASHGKLLINKLNFISILLTFVLAFIEFAVLGIAAGGLLNLNGVSVGITCFVLAFLPVFYLIKYVGEPSKRSNKSISGDIILTSLIIVFNLILFNFALGLWFDVDFSNKLSLLCWVLIPAAVYVDILFYAFVRYYLSKSSKFNLKNK